MSNEDSLHKVKEISYYRDEALSMMNIYSKEMEGDFYMWLNKFEYVAQKIELPDDKMGELFITMVHDNINKRIRKKCPDVNISEFSYQVLMSLYLRYFNLSNEINLYRKRLRSRNQYEKETIENYADNLRKIGDKCCYKHNVEVRLCEQFVKGIRDSVIRSLLSKIPKSSFNEKVAKAIEFSKSVLITSYVDQALLMINSYHPQKEGAFYTWLNKFEFVADYIGVPDDKIIELFNRMVYNVVHMRVMQSYPVINFSKLLYDQIIICYLRHFSPCETDLHRSRLVIRNQYEKETIRNYADSLLKISNKCHYKTDVKNSLCLIFNRGLRDKIIKQHISLTLELTFEEMVVRAIELSKVNLIWYYVDVACSDINIYSLENEGPFHVWFNKFEYLADNIGVPDNKMIEFFNRMVDDSVHTNVRKALPSINFSKISYEKIIENYLLHFSEYYDYDLHKKRFFCRKQYEKETIKIFSEKLKRIYNKCNYKSNRDNELCIQFINGICQNDIRIHLRKTRCLSFDEMVERAIEFKIKNIFRRMSNMRNLTISDS